MEEGWGGGVKELYKTTYKVYTVYEVGSFSLLWLILGNICPLGPIWPQKNGPKGPNNGKRAAGFGQILPDSLRAKFGQIGLLVVRDEKCAARFGQILPGSLRAKFGQIGLLFVGDEKGAALFGQILPGNFRTKFGQIRLFVRDEKGAARFGQILPGSLRAKFGQIGQLFVCDEKGAARFGQVLPGASPPPKNLIKINLSTTGRFRIEIM